MHRVLVIRFGSLGDLCLLAWSLTRWSRGEGGEGREVTLVTKAAFAPLLEQVPGIDRVVALPTGAGLGGLRRLAGQLRAENFDTIIDAHGILRSHLLLAFMGRRPATRLQKDTAARLRLLGFGHRSERLNRTMAERFDALFAPLDPLGGAVPPLRHLAEEATRRKGPLGLAPGAQWNTKRWPEEHFAALLRAHLEGGGGAVRIYLGPREELWFPDGPLARVAAHDSRVAIIRDRSLVEVAASLAECRQLVTNDSGLLHMAEAVGTPVVAFFGPTVRQFGYFPRLEGSTVLETELECRPCSRNGKKTCHRGDLACLRRIAPEAALEYLRGPDRRMETTE